MSRKRTNNLRQWRKIGENRLLLSPLRFHNKFSVSLMWYLKVLHNFSLVNESLNVWLNVINPDARQKVTNQISTGESISGLAMFTLMTNAKALLITQNFGMMSCLNSFDELERNNILSKTLSRDSSILIRISDRGLRLLILLS